MANSLDKNLCFYCLVLGTLIWYVKLDRAASWQHLDWLNNVQLGYWESRGHVNDSQGLLTVPCVQLLTWHTAKSK